MTDNELEELRNKVKEKRYKESIEKEKQKLKEELDEGSAKNIMKKFGKKVIREIMK